MIQVCDDCGKILAVGEWPWCPHTKGVNTVIPDDVPGGFIVENGFERPTRFDSHSAHEKALAERGLEIRAKWAGPHDRYLTRWDSVDLEGATALLERGHPVVPVKHDRWPQATMPITVTDVPITIRRKDLA